MLIGILLILTLFALEWSAPVAVPVALAILFSVLLSPFAQWLSQRRIPPPLAAALVLILTLVFAGSIAAAVWAPAAEWMRTAPGLVAGIERKLLAIEDELAEWREATNRIERAAGLDDTEEPAAALPIDAPWSILEDTPALLAQVCTTIVLLYLLLAAGDEFLRKVVRVVPTLEDKKRAVAVWREIERQIARYLATLLALNTALGAVTTIALFALGVPNPLLWGVLVGLLHFAPYAGAALSVMILALVGLSSFESLWDALLVPAVYWGIALVIGQFAAPIVLGRRLALSPVVVFLSLILFGWLWGVIGMLMAVPIAASVRIGCEHVASLEWLMRLLDTEPVPAKR